MQSKRNLWQPDLSRRENLLMRADDKTFGSSRHRNVEVLPIHFCRFQNDRDIGLKSFEQQCTSDRPSSERSPDQT